MKLKQLAPIVIAAGLAIPLAGHAADADKDRDGAKVWVKDSVITAKIKAQLAANKPTSLAKLHVDTDSSGVVRLTGSAVTVTDAQRAEAIAKMVDGVTSVDNRIKVNGDK